MGIDYGYIRASTEEQRSTLISQEQALKDAGCKQEHIFIDDATTGKTNMTKTGTAWHELQAKLHRGDRLVVKSHTRLGRKNHQIIYAVGELIEQGVSVWVLDDHRVYDDLDSFEQQILNLNMNSAFSDKERVEISARTRTSLQVLVAHGAVTHARPGFAEGITPQSLLDGRGMLTGTRSGGDDDREAATRPDPVRRPRAWRGGASWRDISGSD